MTKDDIPSGEEGSKESRQPASGPTTEAGKRWKAEADEAKADKKTRRREKNKKKNMAKREKIKERGKGERSRWWYSAGKLPKGWENYTENYAERKAEEHAKEQAKESERERRRKTASSSSPPSSQTSHEPPTKAPAVGAGSSPSSTTAAPQNGTKETAWDLEVNAARLRGNTAKLKCLFVDDLERWATAAEAAAPSGEGWGDSWGKAVTRRFHTLSLRYHPDKHIGQSSTVQASYVGAFQALSAAHTTVRSGF